MNDEPMRPIRWFDNVSSCIVSMVVHTVILVGLALIPVIVDRPKTEIVVEVLPTHDTPEKVALVTPVRANPRFEIKQNSFNPSMANSASAGEPEPLATQMEAFRGEVEPTPSVQGAFKTIDVLPPIPINRKSARRGSTKNRMPQKVEVDLKIDPYIDVVSRFIAFDIGELRGKAGRQAQREFAALGKDAIPALVWGYNQSAYLNQSCPVIVIQSKLNEELATADDKKYYRYAMDNVGKGVPPSAPYASRLQQFRQNLQFVARGGGPKPAKALAEARKRQQRKLVIRRLAAKPDKLRKRLTDNDVDVRWAAARLTAARGLPFVDELTDLLVDQDADVRREAHEALMRLSRGEDYGPVNDLNPQDRLTARQNWRDWWSYAQSERKDVIERQQMSDSSEERASNALRMADVLARKGLAEAALQRYRNIIARYPKTKAAKSALDRLPNE